MAITQSLETNCARKIVPYISGWDSGTVEYLSGFKIQNLQADLLQVTAGIEATVGTNLLVVFPLF